MMVKLVAFYATVTRTQYWFPACPTKNSSSLVFIEYQRMLIVANMLIFHLYNVNRERKKKKKKTNFFREKKKEFIDYPNVEKNVWRWTHTLI